VLVTNDSRKELMEMPVMDLLDYCEDLAAAAAKMKKAQEGR
jgi:hypothetical protein